MFGPAIAIWSGLNPKHWPIARKVAAGPVVIVCLLSAVVVFGWSIAEEHQRLLVQSYQQHSAYEKTALRLPRLLADIQKDRYKLTIWSELNVEGPEITSTEARIDQALDDAGEMVAELGKQHAVTYLDEAVTRYGLTVPLQTLAECQALRRDLWSEIWQTPCLE